MLSHSSIEEILSELRIGVRSPTRLPRYACQCLWTARKSQFIHVIINKEQILVFEIVIFFRRQEFILIILPINTIGTIMIETEL